MDKKIQEEKIEKHQDDWEQIKISLDNLRERINEEGINEGNWDEIRKSFINIWTEDRIDKMILEEYTDTDKKYSFTYWVETVLIGLGNIKGSTSIKFGIYKKADGSGYGTKKYLYEGSKFLDKYKGNGNNEEKAFFVVKQNLLEIIKYSKNGNNKEIDNLGDLSPMFKWKIAFLYDSYENIIPIFSKNLLLEICNQNNIKIVDYTYYEIYEKLLKKYKDNEDIYIFMVRLLNDYYDTKISNVAIYQISDSARQNALLLKNVKSVVEEESDKKFFAWDNRRFKNMSVGDIVFFVNPKKETDEDKLFDGEFRILITRVYDYSDKVIKEKVNNENVYCRFGDSYELSDIGINPFKDYDNQIGLDNSINQTPFVIFEIIEEIVDKSIDFKKWKNIGAGNFTYVENFGSDERLKFIINQIKVDIEDKRYKLIENISFIEFYDTNKKVISDNFFFDYIITKTFSNISFENYDLIKLGLKLILLNDIDKLKYSILEYYFNLVKNKKVIDDFTSIDIFDFTINNIFDEKRSSSLEAYLEDILNFDYIYIYKNISLFGELIEGVFNDFSNIDTNNSLKYIEKDQGTNYNIGLLGKWGKGKTTIVDKGLSLIKKDFDVDIYEVDVWKSYTNIGVNGSDKLGVIKYFYYNILLQYESFCTEKKRKSIIEKNITNFLVINYLFNFLSIGYFYLKKKLLNSPLTKFTELKNNLYNDIQVKTNYTINLWIIIVSIFSAIYLTINSQLYELLLNFLDQKFKLILYFSNLFNIKIDLIEEVFNIFYGFSYTLISFLFIYYFFTKIINFSLKTKIFKRQIIDLNIAEEFKKDLSLLIGRKKRKIVILENIDRLNPDQIIDILGLTKTILNIDNTIYIIPIDQSLIIEGLKLKYKDFNFNPMDYIDKVINFPLFIINPYVDINMDKIMQNGAKISSLNLNINNSIKSTNEYLTKEIITKYISNYIPRKERNFEKLKEYYGDIYNIGVKFYNIKNISNDAYQRLFLFFLSLRYADYQLYAFLEMNPIIFKNIIIKITKDFDDYNSLINNIINKHKLLLEESDEYKILTSNSLIKLFSILKSFYKIEELKQVFDKLNHDQIRELMERMNVKV